jgi:iron(III) transport system substrate-binding protein
MLRLIIIRNIGRKPRKRNEKGNKDMDRFFNRAKAVMVAASALVAIMTGSLGTFTPSAAAAEVNIYSSRHYDADRQLYTRFTAETGIKINLLQGKSNALVERLKREGKNSPADLLITVDAGNLGRAQAAGLFQAVGSKALEASIPARFRESGGHWFGLTMRARVIMYHKDRVKPSELSTYEALGDGKWKGRILIRSSNNIYNQSMVASLIAANGFDNTEAWAKRLVANMARKPRGGDRDQIRAVGAGEGDIAIANTYYLGRLVASSAAKDRKLTAKIGVFFPNQEGRGTHVNVSGAGVTKYAKNKANAIKLLEFLVAPEAQKVFAEANFEYPVNPKAAQSTIVGSWGTFKADGLNVAVLSQHNAEAVRLMDRAGWR